jgi:hypothetical protein
VKPPQPGRRQAVVLCVRQLGSQALLFAPERVIAGARAAGEDRVHDARAPSRVQSTGGVFACCSTARPAASRS